MINDIVGETPVPQPPQWVTDQIAKRNRLLTEARRQYGAVDILANTSAYFITPDTPSHIAYEIMGSRSEEFTDQQTRMVATKLPNPAWKEHLVEVEIPAIPMWMG